MIIAIDFDGVIHDFKNPILGRRMGVPIQGSQEVLQLIKDKAHTIIIFTVWGDEKGQKTISDFMNYYNLPYDQITNIKPNADIYLDDKAIRFTDWEQMKTIINAL